MNILKQSTAVDVLIGPFVDSTDGDSEETALTISNTDVKLSKNGQTMASKNDATACAHDANGMYNCELDATDTNTVGTLVLFVHETGALAVRHEFQVVEEAVYDAMFAASAAGPLQSTTAGRTLDVTAGGAAGIDWGNIENKATANDLSGTDIQLCDTVTTNTDMRGTDGAFLAANAPTNFSDLAITATTGLMSVGTNNDKAGYSISGSITTLDGLNNPTAAAIADAVFDESTVGHTTASTFGYQLKTLLDLIYTDTNSLNGTKIPDTLSLANINAEADTALTDYDAPTNAELLDLFRIALRSDSAIATDLSALITSINADQGSGVGDYAVTADSQEAIADSISGSNPTAEQIADAVLDEALSGHTTAGTLGKAISDIETDTNSLNDTKIPDTISLAAINAECDTAFASFDPPTYTELLNFVRLILRSDAALATDLSTEITTINADLGTGLGSFANTTDATQAIRDHIGDGTNLTEAGGTGDQLTAVPWNAAWDAEVQSECADALTAYGPNTTTPPTAAAIRTEMDSNSTQLTAIAADASAVATDWANGGRLDLLLDAIKAVTDAIPAGGALENISAADVNAQVLDVLNTDTFSELSSVPGASTTITNMVRWIYLMNRNKLTQTSTTKTLRNNADNADIGAATVSDDTTTATRGKFA